MTSHSPKTAALMAYESGALSSAGRARVDRHLRGCTICQRELATIQTYEATVDRIRDAPAPELDWSRMELALEREARAQAKQHRRGWVMPAVGVALAAAAAIALVVTPDAQVSRYVRNTHVAPVAIADHVVDSGPPTSVAMEPAAVSPYDGATITLVAGPATVLGALDSTGVSVGHVIGEGERLLTMDGATLHARLSPALAVALEEQTSLALGTDDGGAELTLSYGRVDAEVHEARTIILAGAYRIEADVASFVIDLEDDGALRLDVRSGAVRVTGPSIDTSLVGPARFPEGTDPLDASTPVGASEIYDALGMLHVARPGIVRWEVGDVAVHGAGELAMRIGIGPATITGWDARDRAFHATVTMTADGLDLSPDELTPEAPRVHAGTLSPDEIRPIFHQHQPELQRCFERQLRATPTLEARVVARIALDMTGTVQSVDFGGDPIPAEMSHCMSDRVSAWIFPPPHGGPFTFSVPIPFEHR